jgi:hypothetical protein
MDPIETARSLPSSLHKYLYADDDPVDKIDPRGLYVEVELGIKSDYDTAVAYLKKSPAASALIASVESDPVTKYTVVLAHGDMLLSPDWTSFDNFWPEINWQPRVAGTVKSTTGVISPALVLAHELEHAYLRMTLSSHTDQDVVAFENKVAQELQSVGENEGVRRDHADLGDFFYVPAPDKRGPRGAPWQPDFGKSAPEDIKRRWSTNRTIPIPRLLDLDQYSPVQ